MTYKIEFYSLEQDHITLHSDGSISIWVFKEGMPEEVKIPYKTSKVLKGMILAEYQLNKLGK